MTCSDQALKAYYNGELDGTSLGQKIREEELGQELAQEYRNGDFS